MFLFGLRKVGLCGGGVEEDLGGGARAEIGGRDGETTREKLKNSDDREVEKTSSENGRKWWCQNSQSSIIGGGGFGYEEWRLG